MPPEYERTDSLVEDDALRRSIEKSGVQQPIIVIPVKDRFTIVKGTRRLAVSHLANFKDIPAIVDQPPDGIDLETCRDRLRFVLTHARQDLSPSQRCNLIKQMMEMFGLSQKDVADYLGVDAGSITNWLAIDRYIPVIVKAIDSGTITAFTARSFDGLAAKGQEAVWKATRKVLPTLSGHQAHRLVRTDYSPRSHPDFYVSPAKTLEKLARTKKGRKAKVRPKLSRDEKKVLSRDLAVKEAELTDSLAELKSMKREIALATQPIRGILRNPDLVKMLPVDVKEEFERFAEVYV